MTEKAINTTIAIGEIIREFLKEREKEITLCNKEDKDIIDTNNLSNLCKIYNEFSLQHELGCELKEKLNNKFKPNEFVVLFEKNIKGFKEYKENEFHWEKKEIDIVVLNKNNGQKYAIELKFPLNGQYPEQMFQFIKDIKFMEQVKEELSFNGTFCLTLTNDPSFYSTKSLNGRKIDNGDKNEIYKYFRHVKNNKKFLDSIKDPVNHKNNEQKPIEIELKLNKNKSIIWKPISKGSKLHYYLIKM